MSILAVIFDNILDDIKRKDHFIFGLNSEGNYDVRGYTFVRMIAEHFAPEFKDTGNKEFGTVISVESDEHHCWFHGIVNHSLVTGWPSGRTVRTNSYLATEQALNEIWERFDDTDELVRPMKSLYLGRGRMRQIGEVHGSIIPMTAAMANSAADLAIYVADD